MESQTNEENLNPEGLTEAQLAKRAEKLANAHLSPEALAGTMNIPYIADTLNSFAQILSGLEKVA